MSNGALDALFTADAFNGEVVLIAGCGKADGIGLACAKGFAAAGATVVMADIDGAGLDANLASLPPGGSHSAHQVDVRDKASVDALIAAVVTRHGRLDTVINAVGILAAQPVLDIDPAIWDQVFAVNTRGQLLVAQAAARQMIAAGTPGCLVLMASNIGRIPRINNASYACSKAAVIHLARSMAMELGKHGISVNALCPGSTATSMLLETQTGGDQQRLAGIIEGSVEQWRTGIPLGRLATVEDQAAACMFLASKGGRFISGQALCVDGAQTYF